MRTSRFVVAAALAAASLATAAPGVPGGGVVHADGPGAGKGDQAR